MSSEERKKEYLAQIKKKAREVKRYAMVFGLAVGIGLTATSCDYSINYEHNGPTIINPPAEEKPQEPDKPIPPVENKEIDRSMDQEVD